MDNIYKMLIENPTTEADRAWNVWVQSLDAHNEAMARLRETAQAVDYAFDRYIKLRG